jgi:hypothetical protein
MKEETWANIIEANPELRGGHTIGLNEARKLFEIIRALPDGSRITVSQTGDKITVQAGRSRFTLARARAEPFQVLFQVSGRAKPFRAAGAEMSRMRGSSGWGRSGVGDGRSVFHSRVGYRMNAFRRGLASDVGRASAHGLPTGPTRMTLTFRSAPGLTGQGSALKAPLAAPPDRSPR